MTIEEALKYFRIGENKLLKLAEENYYAHTTYEPERDGFARIMGTAQIMDLPKQEEHISG